MRAPSENSTSAICSGLPTMIAPTRVKNEKYESLSQLGIIMSDKSVSERTQALYKKTYECFIKTFPDTNVRDPKAVLELLRTARKKDGSEYKETTIRSYLASLIHHHKTTSDLDLTEFRKIYKDLTVDLTKKVVAQSKEGKEHKSLEWPAILDGSEKIQLDPEISDMTKILVSLYTELIPVRNDYIRLRILKRAPRKESGNYIVLNKSQAYIQINEHKTAKEVGPLKQDLTAGLKTRIQNYIEANTGMSYLFDYDGSHISHIIGNAFHKHTGQRVTINTFRHSYITEFRKGDKSLEEKSTLAKRMGHSLWLQELYREVRS